MKFVYLSIVCISILFPLSLRADQITLAADAWPPFNDIPGQDKPGYIVEIARSIYERAGHTVKYVKLPWTRAVIETREGHHNAIIAAAKSDAPDFVFPENEQGVLNYTFFTNTNSDWRFAGIESLAKERLGVIDTYTYSEELDEYIKTYRGTNRVQVSFGELPLENMMTKLLANRLTVFIEDKMVTAFTASKQNRFGQFKASGSLISKNVYLAFSPQNPKSVQYAKILSEGMTELRRSGKLEAILARYGLTDWNTK